MKYSKDDKAKQEHDRKGRDRAAKIAIIVFVIFAFFVFLFQGKA